MNVSQIKQNIQTIITNLQQLETHRDNIKNNEVIEMTTIAKSKQDLETAFTTIQSESMTNVISKLKQRKKKRIHLKEKLKKIKDKIKKAKNYKHELPPYPTASENTTNKKPKSSEIQIAKKYLATIKCLETLHKLKGGTDSCKLNESLNPLKSIWQSIHDKIEREEDNSSIESQWDNVLFGGSQKINMKYGMREFLERRHIWDSYLVSDDNSNGSSIPIGWVLPPKDAHQSWIPYQLKN